MKAYRACVYLFKVSIGMLLIHLWPFHDPEPEIERPRVAIVEPLAIGIECTEGVTGDLCIDGVVVVRFGATYLNACRLPAVLDLPECE